MSQIGNPTERPQIEVLPAAEPVPSPLPLPGPVRAPAAPRPLVPA